MRRLPICRIACWALAIAAFCASAPALCDTLQLTNGQSIDGIIVEETPDKVTVQLDFGKTTIPRTSIRSIERFTKARNDTLVRSWNKTQETPAAAQAPQRKRVNLSLVGIHAAFNRLSFKDKVRAVCFGGGVTLFLLILVALALQEGIGRASQIYLALFFAAHIALGLDAYVGSFVVFGFLLSGIVAQVVGGLVIFFCLTSALGSIKGESAGGFIPIILVANSAVNAWFSSSFVHAMFNLSDIAVPVNAAAMNAFALGMCIAAFAAVFFATSSRK